MHRRTLPLLSLSLMVSLAVISTGGCGRSRTKLIEDHQKCYSELTEAIKQDKSDDEIREILLRLTDIGNEWDAKCVKAGNKHLDYPIGDAMRAESELGDALREKNKEADLKRIIRSIKTDDRPYSRFGVPMPKL